MKDVLLSNIEKIHTTEMGKCRIMRNLGLNNCDVVEYCKEKIRNPQCYIYKKGKNWYCEIDHIRMTINSSSYTVITAHPYH